MCDGNTPFALEVIPAEVENFQRLVFTEGVSEELGAIVFETVVPQQ